MHSVRNLYQFDHVGSEYSIAAWRYCLKRRLHLDLVVLDDWTELNEGNSSACLPYQSF